MPDRTARQAPSRPTSATPATVSTGTPHQDPEKVLCDRCSAEMFRMHAVWRCPSCGFKTDCCGW